MTTTGAEEVDAAEVLVYSTLGCKFCSIAKQTLRQQGIPFRDVDVGEAAAREDMALKAGGATSVPQIFVGAEHVGGCEQLLEELPSGRFAQRLSEAGVEVQPAQLTSSALATPDAAGPELEVRPLNGILNYHPAPRAAVGEAVGAGEVATSLQQRVLTLFDTFVRLVPDPDGGPGRQGVDFEAMRKSPEFAEYVMETGRLRADSIRAQVSHFDSKAKTALFVNLYNSLLLHGSLAVPPGPSDPDARGPFFSGDSGVRYDIGGFQLSLDDIEHGILRSSPVDDKRSFAPSDPRRQYVVSEQNFDPRIHFALNCGAKSCPPIKLYTADNLEDGFRLAAQAFCEAEVQVDAKKKTVTLSRIFLWYGRDFAPTTFAMLQKLQSYMAPDSATRQALHAVLQGGDEGWGPGWGEGGGGWSVEFAPYDWSQNSV